jgi:hypothetical protein
VLPAGVFGGAGIGLACLAALATTADVRPGGGGISPRHRVWVLLLVAATAMLLVPQTGRESLPRPATLWQLSAIFWAWIFLQTGPLAEDIRRHRRARRARREWERVRALHRRVNELLGKISREGIDSLTAEEHAFLREASRHYARRE